MIDKELNDIVRRLETVEWHQTMYGYLQWYYAEEWLYVLKCNAGTENERIVLIRAKNYLEAISKAQIIYGHSDDRRKNKDLLEEFNRLNARIDELQVKNNEMRVAFQKAYGAMLADLPAVCFVTLKEYYDKHIHKSLESVKSV